MTAGVGALLLLAVLVFVADEDTILEEAMDNLKESYIGGRVVANLGCYLGGRVLLEELEGFLKSLKAFLTLADCMSSEKVALMLAVGDTPVASFGGLVEETSGGVVSA
jgi:hypothetical protein